MIIFQIIIVIIVIITIGIIMLLILLSMIDTIINVIDIVTIIQMGSIPGSTVREAPVGVTVQPETLCCCPNLQPYLHTQTRHQPPGLDSKVATAKVPCK